jgi:hypothetical protein
VAAQLMAPQEGLSSVSKYEVFSEISSSMLSRYRYGTGFILSDVKVTFLSKNRRLLHKNRNIATKLLRRTSN